MKYLKIDPFQKHLEESLPDHPSSLYFIFMEDPFDRLFLAERIARQIDVETTFCPKEKFAEEIDAPSLFSEQRVLVCDEVDVKELPTASDLICILTGKTPPPSYKEKEKEGTTLDLRGEKPWDKKNRHHRWLLEVARENGKGIAPRGAALLVEGSNGSLSFLLQELEKLITYSGDAKTITEEMVHQVSSFDHSHTGWELSENIVLGAPVQIGEIDLYSLVGQIRYQLELGLALATGKEPPNASPKKCERFRKKGLPPAYFLEGLQALFDLEMKIRSNISNDALLLDEFRLKLGAKTSC